MAVEALESSEVDIVFAVLAHIGKIFLLIGQHDFYICELTVFFDDSLDKIILFFEDFIVLFADLCNKGSTISLNFSGRTSFLLMAS
jgi:hypothetical protein